VRVTLISKQEFINGYSCKFSKTVDDEVNGQFWRTEHNVLPVELMIPLPSLNYFWYRTAVLLALFITSSTSQSGSITRASSPKDNIQAISSTFDEAENPRRILSSSIFPIF
jgi:hypothetical protein